MGRSWTASLFLGTFVSAVLLLFYHMPVGEHGLPLFISGALRLQTLYEGLFVTVDPESARLLLPLQYLFYTVMAFLSAWICQEHPRIFGRIAFLAGSIFLMLVLSAALWFCGIVF